MQETPWIPNPAHLPFSVILFSPAGVRHLAFDMDTGHFYRLLQNFQPEKITAAEAMGLRPADIDQILQYALFWLVRHPDCDRAHELIDELKTGAKSTVLQFAHLAGVVE